MSSGDIQNLPRPGPVQLDVAEPGLFGLDDLQKLLPVSIIF